MYSNNDFRYYKGGSYLAHYGVKGMKWKKHLMKRGENIAYEGDDLYGYRSKKEKRRATVYRNANDYVTRSINEFKRDAKRLKKSKPHKKLVSRINKELNDLHNDPRRMQLRNLSKKLNKKAFGN